MAQELRVGFAGAGGVGSYFGGLLQQGGGNVTLIARGEHAAAIKRQGLRIKTDSVASNVYPSVVDTARVDDLDRLRQLDWLIFSCKSHQTELLAETVRPFLGDHTRIASLQNGVDNPKNLRQLLKQPVIGGISIRFAAHITSPGNVSATGEGFAIFGECDENSVEFAKEIVAAFQSAQVDVRYTDNIYKELWRKLIINNAVNPLTALLERDTGYVLSDAFCDPIVRSLMSEAAFAARADGVFLDEVDISELYTLVASLDPFKPSMLVDIEMGRTPELDAICGPVIERTAKLGKVAKVTKTVSGLIHARFPNLFSV